MCRLLGVVSTSAVSVADAVGEVALKDFLALTKIHGDGWGVAATDHLGDNPTVEVSSGTALDDPAFTAATHDRRSAATVAHLRWATTGMAIAPENSHPFAADGLAMAHNGSIKAMGPLKELLEPAFADSLRGTTDSERYFALVRQCLRTATSLGEAVKQAVAQLREIGPAASLNALILGADQMVVVHSSARSRLLVSDAEEIGATDLPADHLEDYFSLRMARPTADTVVIGSTGFGDLEWEPLPPECVATISLRDLSVSLLPLT